jgi:hypothetical protein
VYRICSFVWKFKSFRGIVAQNLSFSLVQFTLNYSEVFSSNTQLFLLLSRTNCSSHRSTEDCEARAASGSCGGPPPATRAPSGAAPEAAASARRRRRPRTTRRRWPPPPTRSRQPSPPSPAPRRGTSWPSARSGPPSASRPRSAASWYPHFFPATPVSSLDSYGLWLQNS